jgi:hypothetical protein
MNQNIAGLQLKNCMYSIYQAGRYDDLYCLNEKKTKEWNFTNQNTLFGDLWRHKSLYVKFERMILGMSGGMIVWDEKERLECEHKNKKKADIVWHAILSGQPNLQPFCAGQQKCVSTTWHA